jgi:hypothetical protein
VLTVKVGFFPLDEQLRLSDGHWSEGAVRDAVWLSSMVPYEQARAILQQLGRLELSHSSIWRRVQVWGERFRAMEEKERERANALPAKWDPPRPSEGRRERMGVAMDGTMIHIREEGWKELKIGSVFEVAVEPSLEEDTKEEIDVAHAVQNSYVAHLGGPEMLGQLMWAEAQRRNWEQAVDTEAIGDGAPWIWNLVGLHFSHSRQLVDWYHAKHHLVAASRSLKGEGTLAAQRWLNSRETTLYQGHAERIADELTAAAVDHPTAANGLLREAAYFRNNQHRMNYLEMREEEWAIGSGMIESGAKQYKTRFTGAGMRWSRSGAENLLPLRTATMSHHFDELWQKAYNSPQF